MTSLGILTHNSPDSRTKASPFFDILPEEPWSISTQEGFGKAWAESPLDDDESVSRSWVLDPSSEVCGFEGRFLQIWVALSVAEEEPAAWTGATFEGGFSTWEEQTFVADATRGSGEIIL